MGTAKMPRTSDPADSADDLISELARLMAEDAQGDRAQTATNPSSGAAGVDTLSRPERGASPSARLNASSPGDLYESDELTSNGPISRFPPNGQADVEPRAAPRFQTPPPIVPDAVAPSDSLPRGDLGYESDVLGETDPFASIPAISTADDGFVPGNMQPAPPVGRVMSQPPVPENDPIAELIAAQLQDAEVSAPAPVEEPPQFEETDQFGADQPYPAEEDNFNVSPVFGLGGTQQQPDRSNDPLAEIQNLIGDAVNVSAPEAIEEPAVAEPLPAGDVNDAALAAEAAIAAATAATATGGEVPAPEEDIHQVLARRAAETSDVAEISVEDYQQPAVASKSLGQRLIGPAIAAVLLLAIGGSLWWVFGSGPIANVEAPVLNADTSAVKADPEPVVAAAGDAERSVVFDQLSGNGVTTDAQQLLSRDQSDVAAETEILTPETAVAEVARVVGGADSASGGLANRKVRTVTVRPDGTIVSGDDAIAGGEVLPVDRPDVPALPEGTQTAASEFVNEPIITEQPVAVANPVSALAPQSDALLLQSGTADTTSTSGNSAFAPIPRPRPINRPTVASTPLFSQPLVTNSINTPAATTTSNDQAVDLIASLASQAVAPPVLAPLQAPVTTTTTVSSVVQGGIAAAYVQLSSQRTAEAAQQSMVEINRRYGSSLTGDPLEIQRVDLEGRGTFFRVRMPASSIEVANSVCSSVKLSGGDCFVRSN